MLHAQDSILLSDCRRVIKLNIIIIIIIIISDLRMWTEPSSCFLWEINRNCDYSWNAIVVILTHEVLRSIICSNLRDMPTILRWWTIIYMWNAETLLFAWTTFSECSFYKDWNVRNLFFPTKNASIISQHLATYLLLALASRDGQVFIFSISNERYLLTVKRDFLILTGYF